MSLVHRVDKEQYNRLCITFMDGDSKVLLLKEDRQIFVGEAFIKTVGFDVDLLFPLFTIKFISFYCEEELA